jgi:hypothetical protein
MKLTRAQMLALPEHELSQLIATRLKQAKDHQRAANVAHRDVKALKEARKAKRMENGNG